MSAIYHDSVVAAVRTQLDSLELDDHGKSLAQIALNLALAMDRAQHSETGAVAQAIPSMAKELRATLVEIKEGMASDDPFLSKLLDDTEGDDL